MLETPHVTRTTARHTAVIRFTIARDEMPKVFGPGIGELMAALAAQGMTPAGPVFAHHLKITSETFDFELGVPVASPVASAGRVMPGHWPAMKVAQTVYVGPYEGLPGAWGEFMGWIEAAGHEHAPDLWECYVTNPDSSPDPTTWRTELTRPLTG